MSPLRQAESRREDALVAAEACTRLLVERFGAQRVILFGSLADPHGWHDHSDIDLGVEGLPPEQYFTAYSACRDLLPRGFELDLVQMERVSPEMHARILREAPMTQDPIRSLKGLVEDELSALDRVSQEMVGLLAEMHQPPSRTELRAIASILHEFYNGVERIFERIAVVLGQGVPSGSGWHTDLLDQMARETASGLPAVIDGSLRARLKEHLDFRHFYRHAYGYTLEWSQLRWKAEALPETLLLLRDQLRAFFDNFPRTPTDLP